MLSMRHTQRGLTLIEVGISLLLISILTVIAVPTFQFWVQNSQIRNAAEGMLNGMQLARAEAVRRNTLVQVVLGTDSSWTVTTAVAGTPIQQRDSKEGSANARIAVLPAGADRVTFNGMGWVTSNSDGSSPIAQIDVTSATMAGTEIRALRLIISTGGLLKMCDPVVTAGDPRACS
jgi:type IV fimbrial biogenesis protein FimT